MNKSRYLVLLLAVAFAGCGSKGGEKPDEGAQKPTIIDNAAQTRGANDNDAADGKALKASIPTERIIYFDLDQSDIRSDSGLVVEGHAKYLSATPSATVRLEGHADERGSREYNLALGERRAVSTKRALTVLGASEQQINTLSYGEERPVDPGHNEAAWQRNRRVELIYP